MDCVSTHLSNLWPLKAFYDEVSRPNHTSPSSTHAKIQVALRERTCPFGQAKTHVYTTTCSPPSPPFSVASASSSSSTSSSSPSTSSSVSSFSASASSFWANLKHDHASHFIPTLCEFIGFPIVYALHRRLYGRQTLIGYRRRGPTHIQV